MVDPTTHWFTQAAHAGLSPIPVDTTTKRPLVRWAPYQEEPADELTLKSWGAAGRNIGIVCGRVSGRLICIDIEATFMGQLPELSKRLDAAGLKELFDAWCEGYTETTARGGLHVLIHLEGSGPCEGNRKLAMANPTDVWIETRGEGGYAIVHPSRNGTSGWRLIAGGFDTIAYATLEEWNAVAAVLASFNVVPTPPPQVQAAVTPSLHVGNSWIDDELARLPAVRTVLSSLGWEPAGSTDAYGERWVRPGKSPREGHSASISETDRIYVHSTNAGLPVGNPTLDALDVILASQLGRRPSPNERVAYLRAQRPPAERSAGTDQAAEPAAGSSVHLPSTFWEARPWLGALRDAAFARMLSPDAVFGAFLSAYATTIPMGIWLPAVVGARAPLNTYVVLCAPSGGGKTAAMTVAADLVGPLPSPDVKLGRSLRSGEGLITEVIKPRPKPRRGEIELDDGPSFYCGVQVHFDEGGTLAKQVERMGSTTIPYLNTAWAGSGTVGGAKATESGAFPAHAVRICAVMGVQYGAAANLFTGEAARLGFPQRLVYFALDDPALLSIDVDTMDSSPLTPLDLPIYQHSEFTRYPQELGVPAEIMREVRLWTRDKTVRGLTNPLDGHRMNLRLRVAALFALAEGRFHIVEEDWDLALCVERTSRSTRGRLEASIGDVAFEGARQRGRLDAMRQTAMSDMHLERAVLSLGKKLLHGPLTLRQVKNHLRPFSQRHSLHYREILDQAILRNYAAESDDGHIVKGRTLVGGSGGS